MHPHRTPVTGHVRLEDRKRGGPVWVARLRTVRIADDGCQKIGYRTIKLGPNWTKASRPAEGHFTKRLADEELVRLLDAERERVVGGPATDVTLGQAVDEWLRYSEDDNECAVSTMVDYRRTGKKLKQMLGADRPLLGIRSQDVEAIKTKLKASGLGARTVNRHLVILGGVFRRADAKWGTGVNPATGAAVKRLREPYAGRRIRFYRPEEIHALVGACVDPTYEAMILTAALTGLRLGELRALRWHHVDLMAQRVHVERSYCNRSGVEKAPKSGRVRSVPLAVEVQQALARLRDVTGFDGDDDLVFPAWDGNHIAYPELRVTFITAQRKAKLAPLTFHELRHTFGTICASKGIPLTTVQAYMGHANIATTMIYAHYAPAGDEAALISAAFAGTSRSQQPELETAR